MNCKRVRLEIALWVGNDLDGSAIEGLQRHLSECSKCRQHWEKLKSSLMRLKDPVVSGARAMHDSVWPGLLARLPARGGDPQPVQFNGWLPALAVIAASVAIVAFWQNEPMAQSPMVAIDSSGSRVRVSPQPIIVVRNQMPFAFAGDRNAQYVSFFDSGRNRSPIERSMFLQLPMQSIAVQKGESPLGTELRELPLPPTFRRPTGADPKRGSFRIE